MIWLVSKSEKYCVAVVFIDYITLKNDSEADEIKLIVGSNYSESYFTLYRWKSDEMEKAMEKWYDVILEVAQRNEEDEAGNVIDIDKICGD